MELGGQVKRLKTPKLKDDPLAPYYVKFSLDDHKYHHYAPADNESKIDFHGAPYEVIEKLIVRQECDPQDSQNCSPTNAEFVEFAKDFEQEFGLPLGFIGYRIKNREDARVSLEGWEIHRPLTKKAILTLTQFGRHANEFDIDEKGARAWWD